MALVPSGLVRPWLVACTALLAAPLAWAQARDERAAEAHFTRGVALADAGRWEEAIRAFEDARLAAPLPAVLFNLAEAHRRVGAAHTYHALMAYREYLASLGDAPSPNRAVALERIEDLSRRIARLRIEVSPVTATVRIDDHEVSPGTREVELEPGPHAIVVRADEHLPDARSVTLAEGERGALMVTLSRTPVRVEAPPPPPPPPPPAPEVTYRDSLHLSLAYHIIPDATGLGQGVGLRVGMRLARAFEVAVGGSFNHTNGVDYVVGGLAAYYVGEASRFGYYMGMQLAVVIPDCRGGCVPNTTPGVETSTSMAAAISLGARLSVMRWLSFFVDANVGLMQWSSPTPFVYLAAGPQVSLGM